MLKRLQCSKLDQSFFIFILLQIDTVFMRDLVASPLALWVTTIALIALPLFCHCQPERADCAGCWRTGHL
jgi:hypothetical protein